MSDNFLIECKKIADKYIQNIVFIDDDVYGERKKQKHHLDQEKIIKAFSNAEKICAVYNPEKDIDIISLTNISKKSDIVILDWNMDLLTTEEFGDDDDVVEEEDHRGKYTLDLIDGILFDDTQFTGLKSIIVYTGEIDLDEIINQIYSRVIKKDLGLVKNEYELIGNSYKISVIIKDTGSEKKYVGEKIEKRVISYEKLPEFIINDFTSITQGILPSFSLKAISEIRSNSSKILGLFSKELDNAYLAHRSLLPNQEDAEDLLIELLKDALADTLNYKSVTGFINKDFINNWVDFNINDETKYTLNNEGVETTDTYIRNKMLLNNLLTNSNSEINKRFNEVLSSLQLNDGESISKGKVSKWIKSLLKDSNITLFLNNNELSNKNNINHKFATLTHHKSLLLPYKSNPKLSLGTVVKSTKKTNDFYVCIQQKCDSVRLYGFERKFLFLPLSKISEGKFNFVTPEGDKLALKKKSFELRTIKFIGDKTEGVVKSEKVDDKYLFKQKYNGEEDEQFEWVFDLKDLHAQRIAVEYASQLSRVGLDESEWLRMGSM
ncbi:response regulator receiver domain [Wenyingzhuangia sp. IMCC45533]